MDLTVFHLQVLEELQLQPHIVIVQQQDQLTERVEGHKVLGEIQFRLWLFQESQLLVRRIV